MNFHIKAGLGMLLLSGAGLANAAGADENAALHAEIDALRARLDMLEQRVAASEQQPAAPVTATSASAGNSFNPAIGVIFQGQAWNYQHDSAGRTIAGFPRAGEAGPVTEGLALGETELDLSANVDDKFTAWLTLPIAVEDGGTSIDIEEAWIETTALPAGLSARMGRFYSGVGYLNGKHAHTWDFIDQPLPYQALLGNQYGDDGLQLRWLAPTDIYLELGAEALRGDSHPAGGAAHSGAGAWSVFANFGGDIGFDSSWLAGLSWLNSDSVDRPSGEEDSPLLFTGSTDTFIAHGVWKWAPNGNWKQRNAIVQGEYIRQRNDGMYTLADGPALYDADQSGWYLQGVYQPFPQWRFGARYDTLSADAAGLAFDGTELAAPGDNPERYSFMADWSNSEYSRLRLQYTRDKSGLATDGEWGLQYIFSIGAHGAHTF